MDAEIRILGAADLGLLCAAAPGVFDGPVIPQRASEFLADPRHHMAVAIEAGVIVGFASGVHYVHPDKPPELFVNEVGVAPERQGRGLGRRVLARLLDHARALGCVSAWVLTDEGNAPARRLYAGLGGQTGAPGMQGPIVGFEFTLAGEP